MARYYMALGPFDSRETAERARAGMTESDALRASVLRLRDRTGPNVAARLAAAEERLDSHRERLAAVEEFTAERRAAEETMTHRIGNLEGDYLDHRTRIGDLEREPAPVRPEPEGVAEDPTPEQIEAYLRGSAE